MAYQYKLGRHTRIVTRVEKNDDEKYHVYVPQQRSESVFAVLFLKPENRWMDLKYLSYVSLDGDRHYSTKICKTVEEAEEFLRAEKFKAIDAMNKPDADRVVKMID